MKSVGRRHHWVVAGTVQFTIPNPENEETRLFGEATLNAMVTAQHQYINGDRLGKAQQALQLRCVQKVENPDIKIEDVIILSINYLGHMTDEEFSPPQPENPAIQAAPLAN